MEYLKGDAECKRADEISQERFAIPSLSLMEEAALLSFMKLKDMLKKDTSVLFLAGGGNNGADALALARICRINGYNNICIYTPDYSRRSRENEIQLECCRALSIPFADDIVPSDILIDGLLGVGIRGTLREREAEIIDKVNGKDFYVVSVDLPSGLCDSCFNNAVIADETYTFGCRKRCMYALGNRKYCGKISVLNPSFPQEVLNEIPSRNISLHNASGYCRLTLGSDDYKVTRGRVAVIGGSAEYVGAVRLSAKAALKAGSGMVTVFTDAGIISLVSLDCGASVMVRPFEDFFSMHDSFDAVLLGPGLGRGEMQRRLVERIASLPLRTLVLDADAIRLLGGKCSAERLILTPHVGEFRSLSGKEGYHSPDEFYDTLIETGHRLDASIILKADAVYLCEGERIRIVDGQNPYLGTAGSGDVLSGITASIAALGREDIINAVLLHQLSGSEAHEKLGCYTSDELIGIMGAIR